MGLLVAWQVRSILRSPHPALRAVEAIALSLPLFLLLFAATYTVLSASDPGAFTEPLEPARQPVLRGHRLRDRGLR